MARTQAQELQDSKDFQDAYATEDAVKAVPAEDDFGMDVEAVAAEDGIPNSPEEATEAESETQAELTTGEEPSEVASEVAPTAPVGLSPEEQRLKSWEGRLKARDAQGVSVANEPAEPDESPAQEQAEAPAHDAAEATDADAALKKLSEDFGPEFTSMICALISAQVEKAAKSTNDTVQEIISDIVDSRARAHFEAISNAHPDFMDIEKSPEFRAYVSAMEPEQRSATVQLIQSGSAKSINAMLSAYKASSQPEPVDQPVQPDPNLDAAEGVRSSGMRLPKQPASSSDYSAAWSEFDD